MLSKAISSSVPTIMPTWNVAMTACAEMRSTMRPAPSEAGIPMSDQIVSTATASASVRPWSLMYGMKLKLIPVFTKLVRHRAANKM